jgi:hypothetical protein
MEEALFRKYLINFPSFRDIYEGPHYISKQLMGHRDTQHNDTQHNDSQHNNQKM